PSRQRGIDKCVRAEIEGGEIAVEDIDAAERVIGGVKERLCAVDRQPRVHGPIGSAVLDKGLRGGPPKIPRARPSRNCSVQIGEDEARRCAVCAVVMCDRERGWGWVGDKARWWVDVDLSDGRLASDHVERGRVLPLV